MKIILTTQHDLLKNKNKIIELIEKNLEINFKDRSFSKSEVEKLFIQMVSYVEDGSAKILLAQDESTIAGLLWAYSHNYIGTEKMHINHFIVSENYRRQGIGQKLLSGIIEIAKKKKIEFLDLMASCDNQPAVEFYQNRGFQPERIYFSGRVEEINDYFEKTRK